MARENWRKWGPGDQRGTLNLADGPAAAAAAGLVREGTAFSLAQPISPALPIPQHRSGVSHFMGRDGGDYAIGARKPGGFQFAEDTLILPLHAGTHIDALCHVWYEGRLYNDFEDNTIRSQGAARCGAENLTPIVTRGVLVDLCKQRGAALPDGHTVSRAEIVSTLQNCGVKLRSGDAVLIRTGWLERQSAPGSVDFMTEPGIGVEAALWLAEEKVATVGADNFAIEAIPFPDGQVFPVHQRLIRDFGIPLMEGLVLSELAASGRSEFLFVAAPLPIVGGTASPINPIAVI